MTTELMESQLTEVPRVTVDEVKARLDRGEPIAFVDSRSAHAWSTSDVQIPGSVRVPPDDAIKFLERVPKNRSVITYCT